MAINFSAFDKKKILILGGAILAGMIALVLANNYIKNSVNEQATEIAGKAEKQVKDLSQQVSVMQEENKRSMQQLFNAQQQLQKTQQAQQTTGASGEPRKLIETVSLAKSTPAGKRAVTVDMDILNAVGGLVKPGDFVDVIAHLSKPRDYSKPGETEKITVILFQNVKVLAVGRDTQSQFSTVPTTGTVSITLALNPNEASLLSFAQKQGTLQLALRPPMETDAYALPIASWESLSDYMQRTQGIDLPPPKLKKEESTEELPKPKIKPKPDIEIFKGGQLY